MISALIVAKNEEQFIKGCIERISPYVEEIIFLDNNSTDKTREIVEGLNDPKIKIIFHGDSNDMGGLRQLSLDSAKEEWIWQVDADEWYPEESCIAIRKACEDSGQALSFRVGYEQLSWRKGYKQANFEHYPDRLYKREVVDKYDGLLPNDMTKVKREFYTFRPFLEYDNQADRSLENPKQPILPVKYFHIARSRGYNYEYNKWFRYNAINHKHWSPEENAKMTKTNQWVSGLYDLEEIVIPFITPKNEKVSIIIPCHNYAEFVGKAIQSCLDQTVPAYEIIVVDDFSSDNSIEIIKDYPVKLVKQPHNSGVAHARNAGIASSTGDYFICLDADDELAPDYIEKVLKEMKGDRQVVYTDIQFIGDTDYIHIYKDFSIEDLRENQNIPSACALVDRRVFELVGGFNNDWYEDYSFWLRVANKGFNFKHIAEPLFRYRKHGKSRINMLDVQQAHGVNELKQYGKI